MEIKSCGFLIFRREPQVSFLLLKHPDRWDLPKGHVDPGESEQQCALRELQEETGIAAEQVAIDPAFRFEIRYPVRYQRLGGREVEKTLVIFLGRLMAPVEVQISEHGEYLWHAWSPPHSMQRNTIDPLLEMAARHFAGRDPFE